MVERCVCCGEIIPEGRMVCLMCEKRSSERRKAMCEHERLRTVGHRVFCCECGKELDIAFLQGKNSSKNQPDNTGTDKAPAKKTRAKKAV